MTGPAEARPVDLDTLLAEATAAYTALSPVDRALADSDQRRSFVRGQCGIDKPDVLADEVRRLRGLLPSERLEETDEGVLAEALERASHEGWPLTPLKAGQANILARSALRLIPDVRRFFAEVQVKVSPVMEAKPSTTHADEANGMNTNTSSDAA